MVEATAQAPPEQTIQHGEVSVRVAPDRMSAFLVVAPPGEGGTPASADQALQKLAEAGVVFGIDAAAVKRAVADAEGRPRGAPPGEPRVVARGRPPVPGENGTGEYHPCLTAVSGRPRVRPDGSVDLFDLGLVRGVAKGTVLGTRTAPTPGVPGMNVLGTVVPAKAGREAALRPGKGTAYADDQLRVVATIDGHATLIEGRIIVSTVFEAGTDISPETGNIEFVGSVLVRGNVHPGFWVKAGGDVEIYGGVDGGTVEAGGSITVLYGIQGGGHGHIAAGGSVKAKFIENADVRAGGHVWAADGILSSRVEAGVSVEVVGRRGAIIGGRVAARDTVSARFLGSHIGAATEIVVGMAPRLLAELHATRKLEADEQARLQRTSQGIEFLLEQHRRGLLPPEKHETLRQLAAARDQLTEQVELLAGRAAELHLQLGEIRTARVDALDVCYPGVRVTIGSAHYLVNDPLQRTRLRLNERREVEPGPL